MSEEELNLEAEIHKRALKRIILSLLLLISGIGLIIYSTSPLWSSNVLPISWIDHANEFGWTEEIQKVSENLLENNRAEITSMWVNYIIMIFSGVLFWFSIKIFQNRFGEKLMGDALTRSYWMNFYWLKSPIGSVSVNTAQVVRKRKEPALVPKKKVVSSSIQREQKENRDE